MDNIFFMTNNHEIIQLTQESIRAREKSRIGLVAIPLGIASVVSGLAAAIPLGISSKPTQSDTNIGYILLGVSVVCVNVGITTLAIGSGSHHHSRQIINEAMKLYNQKY